MEPETLRQLVEILGGASGDAVSLLWALVILEYMKFLVEYAFVGVLIYGIYRGVKYAVAKEFWKHI